MSSKFVEAASLKQRNIDEAAKVVGIALKTLLSWLYDKQAYVLVAGSKGGFNLKSALAKAKCGF